MTKAAVVKKTGNPDFNILETLNPNESSCSLRRRYVAKTSKKILAANVIIAELEAGSVKKGKEIPNTGGRYAHQRFVMKIELKENKDAVASRPSKG